MSYSSVPAHVRDAVADQLAAIERSHDVAVALAVARGSHAWGGASPESDYDVGFVYVPTDLRRYAHLRRPPKTILEGRGDDGGDDGLTDAADGEFEYQGWDVRNFARLLAGSNDGAIDLLRSPIRYRLECDRAVLDDLRTYVERAYNPMDLYHAYRGIATSNYRKYVSEHLVRNDDEIFPIVEETASGYVVETVDDGGTMTVSADDERFAATQTKPTVKRNLTICRAAMAARYLKATGERSGRDGRDDSHDLPALEFETFLAEQAPAVFDAERIDLARTLLERKRRGEGGVSIGDAVGRGFARPPVEIDPAIHAQDGPDAERLDAFVDDLIAVVL